MKNGEKNKITPNLGKKDLYIFTQFLLSINTTV